MSTFNALPEHGPLDSLTDGQRASAWGDRLGVIASVGCAIHCAAMPFVIGFLPMLGLSFLADPAFHKWMVAICLALALLAFLPGWRRHQRLVPAVIGSVGLSLISFAAFAGPEDCCPSAACSSKQADPATQLVAYGEPEGSAACCAGAAASMPIVAAADSSVCTKSCCADAAPQPTIALAADGSACTKACCADAADVAPLNDVLSVTLVSTSGEPGNPADAVVCTEACCPSTDAAADPDSESEWAGITGLMWMLMTPLGGLILVAGHLSNRHYSGRCTADCCAGSAADDDVA